MQGGVSLPWLLVLLALGSERLRVVIDTRVWASGKYGPLRYSARSTQSVSQHRCLTLRTSISSVPGLVTQRGEEKSIRLRLSSEAFRANVPLLYPWPGNFSGSQTIAAREHVGDGEAGKTNPWHPEMLASPS